MLVPMELHALALRKGYLSPELAIGWRIGKYAEELFAGLPEVHIAAGRDNDGALALGFPFLPSRHHHPALLPPD